MFFVMNKDPVYHQMAVYEVNVCQLVIYCITTMAVLLGGWQMRYLKFKLDLRCKLLKQNYTATKKHYQATQLAPCYYSAGRYWNGQHIANVGSIWSVHLLHVLHHCLLFRHSALSPWRVPDRALFLHSDN